MSKLIIYVGGKPLINGYSRRDFHWSEAHRCYIWGGKELNDSEFNVAYEQAIKNHADLVPRVRVISLTVEPAVVVKLETVTAVEPVATISVAREISLDDAIAVVARLAPERLKKLTRPAAAPTRVMEVA